MREIYKNGSCMGIQMQIKELVPLSDKTVISSKVCNTTDYESYEYLFPGVTEFKNELGGTVFVFSGTPVAEFHLSTAFSFLNFTRKEQLISLLKGTGEMPVYYPNDEEVYFKCADMPNNKVFCALFNIGLDPIDNIELVCDFEPKRFEALQPNGDITEIAFERIANRYILKKSANILDPVIIFITK